jgi:hypothetical protein
MNTTLGFIKLTALAAVCALGFGIAPSAHADGYRNHRGGWNDHGHSHFSLSINLSNLLFRGGYYDARRNRDRYYDNYNNYYDNYQRDYGYYNRYPQYSIGYSYRGGGYHDRYDRDRWDHDRGGWDRGDWRRDHDNHGGWDRDHYYNDQGRDRDGRHQRHW